MNKRVIFAVAILCTIIALPKLTFAQAPTASFSTSINSGCSPVVVNFTDNSTNTPTSWSWNLGNGVTSNVQNPSTTYITPGTYIVTLTATNANGSSTDTAHITVYASPTISFTSPDTILGCPPLSASFTNNTTTGGSSATYLWDFGDGDTSTSISPTHTYTASGNFNVSLIVTNNLGCTKSVTKNAYIKVAQTPFASFSANSTNSCTTPLTVAFTNSSTNGVSYSWDFGDGSTSSATNPSHTYTTGGSYDVRLITTNTDGCKDTMIKTSYINVGALSANFNMSTNTGCTGQQVSFANTSLPGGGTSIWYYGDGTSDTANNTTHTYSSTGTYTVKLVVLFSNCSDTATKTLTIAQNPTAQFATNDTVGCSTPFSASFTNNSTGAASYTWSFGDGSTSTSTSPTHSYTSLGIYDIQLIAISSNGCRDTVRKNRHIKLKVPTGKVLSQAYYGCAPINIAFDVYVDTPLYANSYTWNFGDGTGTSSCTNCAATHHTFNSSGTYTITATYNTSATCADTVQTTITVGSKPTANFNASPLTLCTFDTVAFTNTSTGADAYEWIFGDGSSISNAQHPTHIYTDPDTFTVTLVAMDHGCRDTITKTDHIIVAGPIADFTTAYSCTARRTYTFTDQSQGGQIYSWNFGDGNTSAQVGNVTHTYATAGSYTVTLTVTDTVSMCSNTYQLDLGSYDLTAQFSSTDTSICKDNNVFFDGAASTVISKYRWNFGDGSGQNKTTDNIVHKYTTGGIYDVRLIVEDTAGCRDTLIRTNYIKVGGANVVIGATPTSGCNPLTVYFTDSSVAGAYPITTRKWVFSSGQDTTITGTSISHTYTTATNYNTKLYITDSKGCVASATQVIQVTEPHPNFTISDTSVCLGDTITFNNISTGYSGTLTCLWDFGDGTTSSSFSPKHAYITPSTYSVKLTVTNSNGCTDSITKVASVKVNNPTAAFTMSDSVGACPPLSVSMTNNSVDANGYAWSFGNNTGSSLTNPTAVYTYPGSYTVKLIATSSAGCQDSATRNVTVYGPTGTFSYSPTSGCNPLTVSFSAVSNNTASYIWDMSNGITQTTTGNSFTYTYTQNGQYLPKLILSDGASCLVPIQGIDTIKVDYVSGDFTFTQTPLCDSGVVQFNDTVYSSLSTVNSYSWDFGDGSSSTSNDPTHNYTAAGNYNVRLIIGNTNGCKDTIIKTVVIHGKPNVSVTPAQSSFCQGQATGISLTASGASTYTWAPTGGLSCTSCANPTALPTTTTTYVVTGVDTNGCSNTDTAVITVNPKPSVNGGSNKTICVGGSVQLTASGANSYTWTPTGTLSCTTCTSPFATPSSTTVYSVIGTDNNGCKDTADVTVSVNTQPTVSAGANQTVCIGDSVRLIATGASTYTWTPTTTLSCTSCDTTFASPTTTTTYTVIGTSGNNCSDTATVTVSVNTLPNVNASNDTAICIGNSAQLIATGANTYTWTPTATLSCGVCANPTATPTTTTDYVVTGTDGNGCKNTDTVAVTINNLPNVSAGNDATICLNDSTQLTASGASSYTWAPATTLSCSSCTSPFAKPAVNTTYVVTGTDANGCKNSDSVDVSVNALPNVSAGPDQAICNSSSVQLQASGASTYTWTPTTALSCTNCAAPTATPSSTTTYIVTGTGTNGCKNTDTVVVAINALPNISAGNNTSACIGGSVTLNASGATNYTWSPSTGLSCTNCTSPTANPTTTTTYKLIGSDGNGCVDSAQVTVTVNPLPNINAGNDVSICSGSITALTATGGNTYIWTPTSTLSCSNCANPTATPPTTTTYTVTGTDANGCTDSDSVKVTVIPLPNITVTPSTSICLGDTVQLQATGGVNYSWSPSIDLSCNNCANPVADPNSTITYTVTGLSASNCADTAMVTITVNPLPTVNVGNDRSICDGDTVQLQATGAQTYTWSPSNGLSCSTCSNPTAYPTDTTQYTITGIDSNGCKDSAQLNIFVKPNPIVSVAPNYQVICEGDSVQLQATGATTYTWTPASSLSCNNCDDPLAKPNTSTSYVLTGFTNGCGDTANVTINVLPKPNVKAGSDVDICIGESTILSVTGGMKHQWTPTNTLSCDTCKTPLATPTVTTQYLVTGTDNNDCSSVDTVNVNVHNPPAVDAGTDKTICDGESILLTATGAATYTWSPSATLSCTYCASPTASPVNNTTYKVVGVDQYGCSDSDQVSVTVLLKDAITFGKGDTICVGQSTQLNVDGGDSYQWSPASSLSNAQIANPTATPTQTTKYEVVVSQKNCFADTGYIDVVVNPVPEVDLGPDHKIKGGTSVQLLIPGDDYTKFTWTPAKDLSCDDCQNPKATPGRSTTYTVTVENKYGCTATDDVTIYVTCDAGQLFVANTFTPNGDGLNDRFYPQGRGIMKVDRFTIYSRWGELIFDRKGMPVNDPILGWDGTYKGEPLKPDVFVYIIHATCETGEPIKIKGDISLVR